MTQERRSRVFLLELGRYHAHSGVPADFLGLVGPVFVHAIRPCLRAAAADEILAEEAWLTLFAYLTRVMTVGHRGRIRGAGGGSEGGGGGHGDRVRAQSPFGQVGQRRSASLDRA
jgi:hypothetical protein